jgi:hypothetical protein
MPFGLDDTAYSVIAKEDGAFAVEMIKPGGLPSMVDGFDSEIEAQEWIAHAITEPAEGASSAVPGQTALM